MKEYEKLTQADRALNRIVPIPKQAELLEGAPLKKASSFTITAPEAEFGPVKTAGARIRALLDGTQGDKVTVTLSLAEPEAPLNKEGYRLTVTADSVTIIGYGENGLLYGVITLEQMFAGAAQIPAVQITDWPENPIRGFKEESRYGSSDLFSNQSTLGKQS